jgi:pimeloyl-ACP methyl ester carboxylesterase
MLYSKIEGSGKPLLILHGFLGMSDNWKTMNKLAQVGFEVHLLIPQSWSKQSLEFSYELMAQDINEYCVNNLTSVDLLGHSMGGKTRLQLNILK